MLSGCIRRRKTWYLLQLSFAETELLLRKFSIILFSSFVAFLLYLAIYVIDEDIQAAAYEGL